VNTDPIEGNSHRRTLLLLIAAVFIIKAVIALWVIPTFQDRIGSVFGIGPSDNYDTIARNIVAGFGYRFAPQAAPTMMREPGYPIFLAGLRYLLGSGFWIPIVANLVFSAASALLIGRLARKLTQDRWTDLLAPLLFMIHPGVAVAELRSGIEVPFTFLLVLFFLVLHKALTTEKIADYVKSGIVLGLACSVRSTVLLFGLFLLIQRYLSQPNWRSFRDTGIRVLAMMVAMTVMISPWIVRNYLLVQRFVPTASVQGISMQVGYYQCVHGDTGQGFHDLEVGAAAERNVLARAGGYQYMADPVMGSYHQDFFDSKDELRFNSLLQDRVVDSYVHSPLLFLKCASENVVNFWVTGKNALATTVAVCVQVPYLLLAFAGLVLGLRHGQRGTLLALITFVIYTMAVCAPIHAEARYSVPLVPILSLFAAIALSRLIERYRLSRRTDHMPQRLPT
jgi:hypothetical protein